MIGKDIYEVNTTGNKFLKKKVLENESPGHRNKSIESIALRIVCKIVSNKLVDKIIMYIYNRVIICNEDSLKPVKGREYKQ